MGLRTVLALTALVAVPTMLAVRAEEPEVIPWRTDLAAARDEAERTGKPLFVVFRCPP